uniref:Uncharacterized protein n=1 Tax=Meloidogyne javanica TaxID=6303 RepID=A0A915N934_MELJA
KEYIRGIIVLYKFGGVTMNNFRKYLGIQDTFVQLILAAHGICVYSHNNTKNKEIVGKDLQKLKEKMQNNKDMINVTEKTIEEINSKNIKIKKSENKNSEETNEDEYSSEETFSEDSNVGLYQCQPSQSAKLFQTSEDNDPHYWENWNEATKN